MNVLVACDHSLQGEHRPLERLCWLMVCAGCKKDDFDAELISEKQVIRVCLQLFGQFVYLLVEL